MRRWESSRSETLKLIALRQWPVRMVLDPFHFVGGVDVDADVAQVIRKQKARSGRRSLAEVSAGSAVGAHADPPGVDGSRSSPRD